MKFEKYIACICEGSAEAAIIESLIVFYAGGSSG